MEFSHVTVLLNEAIEALNVKPDGIYVDGTAGGGGHSSEILKKLTTGKLISIDKDPDAIKTVTKRFEGNRNSVIVQSDYSDIKNVLNSLNIEKADGILLDLGVSSWQFDCPDRGFSYNKEARLDMRMSQSGVSAYEIVNEMPLEKLTKILNDYGEEKLAYKIALAIVRKREISPIVTTTELAEIIKDVYPASLRRLGNPARKSFQAIRIAVNDEIEKLKKGLDCAFDVLSNGGRLAVITFHSIEDRVVKLKMGDWKKGCICPPDFPVCVCNKTPAAKLVYKKPIEPSKEEIDTNPRSRSARLRVCEKIHDLD